MPAPRRSFMNLYRSLQTAFANLRANKLRSGLTMLGVIIGVSAVIIMVSIVEGARAGVVREIERLGSKLIVVIYNPFEEQKITRRIDGMTMQDVSVISEQCDLVENVCAEKELNGQKAHNGDRLIEDVKVVGVMPAYGRIRAVNVRQGRFITQDDLSEWAKVCVIASEVRDRLFPREDPLGKDLEVAGVNLTVVGVLEKKGRSGPEGNPDKNILVPLTTIQKRLEGSDRVEVIFAQPRDTRMLTAAMDQIWQTLMRRHDNMPGFRVDSQENLLRAIGRILNIFGFIMGGIASLALLVGGIGVMNIMLVSVTERTREIGIRKAVGAKRRDILMQFLIESATVTGFGGLLGIATGAGFAYLVGYISRQVMSGSGGPGGEPGIPVHLPLWAILGAFGFSAFIGLFFGIYPAVRAARLEPIAALRHE